jgi:predicted deacylase
LERKRRALVVAFGLDSAAFFPPNTFGTNSAQEAIEAAGVVHVTPELGGGTGWFKNGEENVAVAERGIWNILKAMDIIDGDPEADGPECTIYNANVVLWKPDTDGLFIRLRHFGEHVAEGDVYGLIVDPYTGEELAHILNTHDATVIPSGQEWPTVGMTSIGILGIVDEIVDRRTAQKRITFAPGASAHNREVVT